MDNHKSILKKVKVKLVEMLAETSKLEVMTVDLDIITANPYQPRRTFSEESLQELAASIKTVGLIQPPTVRPHPQIPRLFQLVSGERRFRAAQIAGLTTIPVIISDVDNTASAEVALVENIHRSDLNPIEIARALRRLMMDFNYQQEQVADRVGKKRSSVANYLRLLSLPVTIQDSLAAGTISTGHGKAILSLQNEELQQQLYAAILERALSVRQSEALAKKIAQGSKQKKEGSLDRDYLVEAIRTSLEQKFGTKVTIDAKEGKGKIAIEYYSLDDLDRLLELWGVRDGD